MRPVSRAARVVRGMLYVFAASRTDILLAVRIALIARFILASLVCVDIVLVVVWWYFQVRGCDMLESGPRDDVARAMIIYVITSLIKSLTS